MKLTYLSTKPGYARMAGGLCLSVALCPTAVDALQNGDARHDPGTESAAVLCRCSAIPSVANCSERMSVSVDERTDIECKKAEMAYLKGSGQLPR